MLTWLNDGVNNYFSHYFSHLGSATSLPTETIRARMTLVAQIDQPHRRVYDQGLCTT